MLDLYNNIGYEGKMKRSKLTDLAVKNMRAPEKGRIEIFDDVVQRLFLRITDRGHKSWCYGYRFNGRNKRLIIGSLPLVMQRIKRESKGSLPPINLHRLAIRIGFYSGCVLKDL